MKIERPRYNGNQAEFLVFTTIDGNEKARLRNARYERIFTLETVSPVDLSIYRGTNSPSNSPQPLPSPFHPVNFSAKRAQDRCKSYF